MLKFLSCFLFLFPFTVFCQSQNCKNGICVYEDSLFKLDKFYRGQTITIDFCRKNITNEIIKTHAPDGTKFNRILPDGSIEVLYEWRSKSHDHSISSSSKYYTEIKPSKDYCWQLEINYVYKGDDMIPEYRDKFRMDNKYPVMKPGKYEIVKPVLIAPNDKEIIFRKEFEIIEVSGQLEQEFLDYMKCINYCMSIDMSYKELDKVFDPEFPTITWFTRKYPNSIYSAEMFRYLAKYWNGGYTSGLSLEGETKWAYLLLGQVSKINGNFGGLIHEIGIYAARIDHMYIYRIIEDEAAFIDQFLQSISEKPPVLSDECIMQYRRFHKGQNPLNYARLKK